MRQGRPPAPPGMLCATGAAARARAGRHHLDRRAHRTNRRPRRGNRRSPAGGPARGGAPSSVAGRPFLTISRTRTLPLELPSSGEHRPAGTGRAVFRLPRRRLGRIVLRRRRARGAAVVLAGTCSPPWLLTRDRTQVVARRTPTRAPSSPVRHAGTASGGPEDSSCRRSAPRPVCGGGCRCTHVPTRPTNHPHGSARSSPV